MQRFHGFFRLPQGELGHNAVVKSEESVLGGVKQKQAKAQTKHKKYTLLNNRVSHPPVSDYR